MPSAAVDAAFKSRLTTFWTATPVIGIDITEPPTDGSSFLVLQYPVVNAFKPVLSRHYFEEGAARMVLNVVRGIEATDGAGWADTLATLFADRKLGGGIETFVPSAPITNDDIENGNYVELSVIVPYRYQFDRT